MRAEVTPRIITIEFTEEEATLLRDFTGFTTLSRVSEFTDLGEATAKPIMLMLGTLYHELHGVLGDM